MAETTNEMAELNIKADEIFNTMKSYRVTSEEELLAANTEIAAIEKLLLRAGELKARRATTFLNVAKNNIEAAITIFKSTQKQIEKIQAERQREIDSLDKRKEAAKKEKAKREEQRVKQEANLEAESRAKEAMAASPETIVVENKKK